jgi:hypothetical protein
VLVEVLGRRRTPELLAQLPQLPDEVGRPCEAARDEARLPLRLVPAPEVLDDGLRVDRRLRVGLELPHRRGAPQPLGGRAQLPEDLLVGVALADSGLELGQRGRIDAPHSLRGPALLGHGKKNRTD